jgi:hypothetical protein
MQDLNCSLCCLKENTTLTPLLHYTLEGFYREIEMMESNSYRAEAEENLKTILTGCCCCCCPAIF